MYYISYEIHDFILSVFLYLIFCNMWGIVIKTKYINVLKNINVTVCYNTRSRPLQDSLSYPKFLGVTSVGTIWPFSSSASCGIFYTSWLLWMLGLLLDISTENHGILAHHDTSPPSINSVWCLVQKTHFSLSFLLLSWSLILFSHFFVFWNISSYLFILRVPCELWDQWRM